MVQKQHLFMLVAMFFLIVCKGQDKIGAIITEKQGDLDKDGIPEKVVVYNTDTLTELGLIRLLCIYKKDANNNWKVWKKSNTAILKSKEGGTMGDPFQEIEIKNGILAIKHYGGSSWHWSYTHKYRYQNNDFYLIGVSTTNSFREDNTVFDYNLSTSKAIYTSYINGVLSNKEVFKHKMKAVPKLNNMHFGKHQISTPKLKKSIYF